MSECQQCGELGAELARARKELDAAKELLGAIADYATATATVARNEMTGNIPRQRWEWLKAQFQMGNAILEIMKLEPVPMKSKRKRGLAGIGQGMFEGLFGG